MTNQILNSNLAYAYSDEFENIPCKTIDFKEIADRANSLLLKNPINEISKPKTLSEYISITDKALKAKRTYLLSSAISPEKYKSIFKDTQEYAILLLEFETLLGDHLRGIKTNKGIRTDLKLNEGKSKFMTNLDRRNKTKAKIIKEEYGLSERRARDIQQLTPECVKKAIAHAMENGEIVTRALALRLKKEKHNKENNGKFKGRTGIYASNHQLINMDNAPIYYTNLFACAGTCEAHLEANGFIGAVANEFLPERAELYTKLHPNTNMVVGDINEKLGTLIKLHKENKCELLMASPPCQTFSKAGKRDFTNPKTNLFIPTLEFIKATMPKWVLIENVSEFLTAKPKSLKGVIGDLTIGDYIVEQLKALGYDVNVDIQNGADYGTAQSRERAIILASTEGVWEFPKKDDYRKMLWEAIGDLPSLEPGEDSGTRFHKALEMAPHDIYTLAHTPTGCSAHHNAKEYKPKKADGSESGMKHESSYKRQDWGKPCPTVTTANGSFAGYHNIHPGKPKSDGTYSDPRFLTILELFRVTGLPDDYPIPEDTDDTLIRDIIGECFLPLHVLRLMTTLPRNN